MDRYFDMLSSFNEKWPTYPKDKIFTVTLDNRTGYAFACEIDGLRTVYGYTKGPKNGIEEFHIITDPSQSITIDQLLCHNCSMKCWIVKAENFDTASQKLICSAIEKWKESPNSLRTVANIVGFGKTSLPTLSGGRVSPR